MADRFVAWVCGRSLAGIAGSNPTGGTGRLSLMNFECCHVQVCALTDHMSSGILPNVVCLSVIVRPRKGGPGPQRAVTIYGDGRETKKEPNTMLQYHISIRHLKKSV